MEAVQGCIPWDGGGAVWQNVGERRYTEMQKPMMVDGRGGEGSVLARIGKFSNLPVIRVFFTVIKTKDQLFVRGIWGDEMREKARKSAV